MLSDVWRKIGLLALGAGLLIILFLAAEFARLFLLFYRANPLAGYGFLAVLALAAGALAFAGLFSSRAPEPMPRPDPSTADHHELVRYCRYLGRRLIYLGNNPLLNREARHAMAEAVHYIDEVLRAHPLRDDLLRTIDTMEKERIPAFTAPLREVARQTIQTAALQAMQRAMAAPTEPVPLGAARFHQAALILRVTDQLARVSRLRERIQYAFDAGRLVWAFDAPDWSRRLQRNLLLQKALPRDIALELSRILWSGWQVLLTGDAAVDRCLHTGLWTPDEAASRLAGQMAEMAAQLRPLFLNQVLPDAKPILRPEPIPEAFNENAYWSGLTHAVKVALEAAAGGGNRQVAAPPSTMEAPPASEPNRIPEGTVTPPLRRRTRRHRQPALLRIAVTFGQRIKYGLLSRRLYR